MMTARDDDGWLGLSFSSFTTVPRAIVFRGGSRLLSFACSARIFTALQLAIGRRTLQFRLPPKQRAAVIVVWWRSISIIGGFLPLLEAGWGGPTISIN